MFTTIFHGYAESELELPLYFQKPNGIEIKTVHDSKIELTIPLNYNMEVVKDGEQELNVLF